MKKTFAIILSLAFTAICLSACSGNNPQPNNNTSTYETAEFSIEQDLDTFILTAENNPEKNIEIKYNKKIFIINYSTNIFFYTENSIIPSVLEKYQQNNIPVPESYNILPDIGRTGIQINLYDNITAEDIYNDKNINRNSQSIITFTEIETFKINNRVYHYFEGRFTETNEVAYRYCILELENNCVLFQITTLYDGNIAEICDALFLDYKI